MLTEAIQTVLRAEGVDGAYELLKDFSRGKVVGERALKDFIAELPISSEAKERLSALTFRKPTTAWRPTCRDNFPNCGEKSCPLATVGKIQNIPTFER